MNPASPKRKPGQSLFKLNDEALSALPPAVEVFMAWQLDPQCPFYPGRDTVSHLFNLCPHFKHIRSDLQKALQASKIKFKPNQLDRAMLIQKAYQPVANFLKLSSCFPSLDGPRLHQLKFTLP
ncbi:hypothetical protein PGTUg99_032668 [Puccinia graminis f. sp. tritici]|uniref:Uncharacterized protein n=1 Tax=Puccinia graminis f. sp. tritici TaxID=56615 RepID=A0A5B0NLN7_PUCGR|nr:hypothetical protein PGTUg99_032668 [Puccinia graminis f. sp. tritici]